MGTGELLVPNVPDKVQEPDFRASVSMGAYTCVYFNGSGKFGLSQPGALSTMPSIGIAKANVPSGQIGTIHNLGDIAISNLVFSGFEGNKIFVGTSSQIVMSSPINSGECVQTIGQITSPTSVYIMPEPFFVQIG